MLARGSLPLLQRLDPERAHDLGLVGLRLLRPIWPAVQVPAQLAVRCLGLDFAHPLGLAAGFDKNGDYLDALGALGFSHIELGTVTPRPQPGNPKPRMFRIAADSALVNRMGFNNKGADHLLARLGHSRYAGIRGISIGKNVDTPVERAEADYVACLRKVYDKADYIAVNVSSPNTARLRELQGREGLERVLGALQRERESLLARHAKRVPLLVKIAPNLTPEQVASLAASLRSLGVDGVIATNTSNDLTGLRAWPEAHRGGLSGAPLHALSVDVIRQLRAELGRSLPIIGVGGIMSAEHALETLRAGANLIQIYTGFAYRGHRLVEEILEALEALQ
jgi:dihydroorotate dehydrogenase